MTARRDRQRQQRAAEQQAPTAAGNATQPKGQGDKSRKEKLSNYLIDISKYVMTGVVIASLFKDLNDSRTMIYIVGLFIAFMALGVGLVLTDKKKGE